MKRLTALILSISMLSVASGCEFEEQCDAEAPSIKVQLNGNSFSIDAYEASRSNATELTAGTGITLACNYRNTIPWSNVTYEDAKNACLDAGKRLCTKEEWIAACQQSMRKYPYGDSYSSGTCHDTDGSETAVTGSKPNCKTETGIFDMSGNVREWVEGGILMGGAYNTANSEVTCTSMLNHASDHLTYTPSMGDGFRCCQNESLL